jgi:hypothetical protein
MQGTSCLQFGTRAGIMQDAFWHSLEERTSCFRPSAYLQQSMTILLPMRRVAALYGRIDALYLNAGRQFFGECAVHHGHIAQIAIMTSLPRNHLSCCACVAVS